MIYESKHEIGIKVKLPKINSKFYLVTEKDDKPNINHVKLLSITPHCEYTGENNHWFSFEFFDDAANETIYLCTSYISEVINYQLIDIISDINNEEIDIRLAYNKTDWNFGTFAYLFDKKTNASAFIKNCYAFGENF